MSKAIIYSLKVWITIVTASPLISNLLLLFLHKSTNFDLLDALSWAIIEFIIATFVSFCSLLLFFLFTYLFTKQSFEERQVKLALSAVGFILVLIPLLWNYQGEINLKEFGEIVRYITYPAITIMAIWFFSLKPFESIIIDFAAALEE